MIHKALFVLLLFYDIFLNRLVTHLQANNAYHQGKVIVSIVL